MWPVTPVPLSDALSPSDVLGPQLAPHLPHFVLIVVGGGQRMTILPLAIGRFAGMRDKPFLGRAVPDTGPGNFKFFRDGFFVHGP